MKHVNVPPAATFLSNMLQRHLSRTALLISHDPCCECAGSELQMKIGWKTKRSHPQRSKTGGQKLNGSLLLLLTVLLTL
jgi:hypothetical protein